MTIPNYSSKARMIGQSRTSAIFNIVMTCIGVGILGFPKAMASAGYMLGIIIIILCSIITCITTHLLSICIVKAAHISGTAVLSYEDIGKVCFGPSGSLFVKLVIHSAIIGTCGLLMLLLGSNTFSLTEVLTTTHWTIIWTCVMMPLACLRTMKHVGFVSSTIGIGSVVVMVVSIIVASIANILKGPFSYDIKPHDFWGVGTLFSTSIFAYAINVTFVTVIRDMHEPKYAPHAINVSFALMFIISFATAISGYFGYGQYLSLNSDTIATAIYSANGRNAFSLITLLAVVVVCATHFLVMLNPSSRALERLFHIHVESESLSYKHGFASICIRVGLVVITALIAIFVPRFDALINLLGSVSFSFIQLILPIVFYLRLKHKSNTLELKTCKGKAVCIGLGIILLLSVFGMVCGIRDAIHSF